MARRYRTSPVHPEDLDPATLGVLLLGKLRERVRTHPVSTLAGAAGVGYVLGGGIPDFILRFGVQAAARVATQRLLMTTLSQTSVFGSDIDEGARAEEHD